MICKFCQRGIVEVDRAWVDPEATGDDAVWRETCESNHLDRIGAHEPQYTEVRIVTTLAFVGEVTPAIKGALDNLAAVMDVQAEDGLYESGLKQGWGDGPNEFLVDFEGRETEVQLVPEASHRGRGVTVQVWPTTALTWPRTPTSRRTTTVCWSTCAMRTTRNP